MTLEPPPCATSWSKFPLIQRYISTFTGWIGRNPTVVWGAFPAAQMLFSDHRNITGLLLEPYVDNIKVTLLYRVYRLQYSIELKLVMKMKLIEGQD